MLTEKRGKKEQEEYIHNVQSAYSLFRNTFKPSELWTALETANPMIIISVSVYPSSSSRMKNWEAPYHSHLMNALSHLCGIFKLQEELLLHFILLPASCQPETLPVFSP